MFSEKRFDWIKRRQRRERPRCCWVGFYFHSILSCTVTPPYPLFPTAYFKKLVDNITIQQTKQNKHIIIILASPTFTIPLHRELQREKESPFIKLKKKVFFFAISIQKWSHLWSPLSVCVSLHDFQYFHLGWSFSLA